MSTRGFRSPVERAAILGVVALACALAAPAANADSLSVGPLVLSDGTGKAAIQSDGADVRSFGFTIQERPPSQGYGRTASTPESVSTLTVTKTADSASGALAAAARAGTHYRSAALTWTRTDAQGTPHVGSLCLGDVVVSAYRAAPGGAPALESLRLAYTLSQIDAADGRACASLPAPPAEPVSVGFETVAQKGLILARVSCLSASCRGRIAVRLPAAVCTPRVSNCLPNRNVLTGGVKESFAGGVHFRLGDGRVKVVRFHAPRRAIHRLASADTQTIVAVLRIGGRLRQVDGPLNATGAVPKDAVSLTTPDVPPVGAGAGQGAPGPLPKPVVALQCVSDQSPVVLTGSTSPVLAGQPIVLTYTPIDPPGAPVTHTVTTNADGTFSDSFTPPAAGDWSADATFPGGPGLAASTSMPCALPGSSP